jgi:hypothetical protein
MAVPKSPHHDVDGTPTLAVDRTPLFKEDRPRHIDRYISFFGEDSEPGAAPAVTGFELADRWSSES